MGPAGWPDPRRSEWPAPRAPRPHKRQGWGAASLSGRPQTCTARASRWWSRGRSLRRSTGHLRHKSLTCDQRAPGCSRAHRPPIPCRLPRGLGSRRASSTGTRALAAAVLRPTWQTRRSWWREACGCAPCPSRQARVTNSPRAACHSCSGPGGAARRSVGTDR